MPLTSNTFYLSNAEYIQNKKRVSVEFSSSVGRKSFSFSFIPFILIHNSLISGSLQNFFKQNKLKSEKVVNGLKVFSSDLSLLEEINLLCSKKCILLSPERQFLLSKNWSFFDEFKIDDKIKKKNLDGVPDVSFNFACGSLKENVSEMLSFSKQNTKEFMNKIILSNILCVNLTVLPKSTPFILDSFIEAVLFRNNFAFLKKKQKFDSGFSEKNYFSELKEINFSSVWPVLFSFPFYNLGFDSVNCNCCVPSDLNQRNILPSSLIEIKFVQDAVYFESSSKKFSSFFHSCASGEEKRIKRMKEWKLKSIPLGPFFRNDVLRVPFDDALTLFSEEKAVFLSDHSLNWFCTKKENFFSRELNELNNRLLFFNNLLEEMEKKSIKENKIAFKLFLENNLDFLFFSEFASVLKLIFSSVPFHLTSFSSAFFDSIFSEAVSCVFSSVLSRFSSFSILNSSKSYIRKNAVLLDSRNPLEILSEFSRKENLPLPELIIS